MELIQLQSCNGNCIANFTIEEFNTLVRVILILQSQEIFIDAVGELTGLQKAQTMKDHLLIGLMLQLLDVVNQGQFNKDVIGSVIKKLEPTSEDQAHLIYSAIADAKELFDLFRFNDPTDQVEQLKNATMLYKSAAEEGIELLKRMVKELENQPKVNTGDNADVQQAE